ncbi:MAG: DUF59 domain-containing protein, partial [Acidimicrobiia bacterium]|nr:DUF59 domain-containing protein [Acidimicrobiia bacterium]
MSEISTSSVIDALRPVHDPELHRSIVDLGMVRDVVVDGDVVSLTVALTIAGCPLRNEIQQRVNTALRALAGVRDVRLNFGVMTDDERAALREKLHGSPAATAGSTPAQGHAQGRAIPFAQPGSKTRPLLISSGKGGVGKTTISTNLAVSLHLDNQKILLVDSDPQGSLRDWNEANEGKLIPVVGLDRETLAKDIEGVKNGYD